MQVIWYLSGGKVVVLLWLQGRLVGFPTFPRVSQSLRFPVIALSYFYMVFSSYASLLIIFLAGTSELKSLYCGKRLRLLESVKIMKPPKKINNLEPPAVDGSLCQFKIIMVFDHHEQAAVVRDNPKLFESNVRRAMAGGYVAKPSSLDVCSYNLY